MKRILLFLLFIPLFTSGAPIFTCGFECGVSGSVGQHWGSFTNISFNTSMMRTGSRCIRAVTSSSFSTVSSNIALSNKDIVARFYVNFNTLPNVNVWLFRVSDGTNLGGCRFHSSDNKIYAEGGGGGTSSTGITVTTGQWYRVDVKINLNSNPRLYDVQVDGSATTQASDAFATATATSFFVLDGSTGTYDICMDDLIIGTASGDYPFGAGYVNHFIPSSDGTHVIAGTNDFERTLTGTDILVGTTDAYELVNDVPLESGSGVDWINMIAPAAANDYVLCLAGPAPGISTPSSGPRTVEVIVGIHQAATGTGNMAVFFKNADNTGNLLTVYSATGVAGVTTIVYKRAHFATNGSLVAWTTTTFNGAMLFFHTTSTVDANPDQYFDCAMIEAEFSGDPPAGPTSKPFLLLGVGN